MTMYRRLFRLFLGTEGDVDREVDDEISAHLEMRAAELERRGLSREAARAEAERRFGDVARARRRLRDSSRVRLGRQRRRDWLASIASDLTLATRRARSAPGHTAISLAIFALAIGLTTAGFTVVDRVMIRSLPFPDPDRLVALQTQGEGGQGITYLSSSIWLDWAERARTLESSALHSSRPMEWGFAGEDDAFNVDGRMVTPEFFDVLGVRMLAGRGFRRDDAGEAGVVVSEGFWRRVLGAAPLPVTVELSGSPREVIGVVPRGLEYPLGTEVYRAFYPTHRPGEAYNWLNYFGVGRLSPGVTAAHAAADLGAIARAAGEANPEAQYLYGAVPIPLRDLVVGEARRYLLLLMGAVLVLLLIACANLAGLGLARGSTRTQEVALRLSLGAGRPRLVRQLLTEHLLLALAGGALGTGLAIGATRAFATAAAAHLPRASEIAVDGRVLLFAVAVSLLAGVLAGLAPALWTSRTSLRESLSGGTRSVRGGRGLPGALTVAVEVALALVLLTGGSLLIRSFSSVLSRDLGFEVEGVITADASLGGRYAEGEWPGFWSRVEERLASVPGVAAFGLTNAVPTGDGGTGFIEVEGHPDQRAGAGYRVVSDAYFEAIGMDLQSGRSFGAQDREGTERVTVVNRAMAERYWPGESPIGKRVKAYSMEGTSGTPGSAPWLTVVGVVGDVRQHGHEGDVPTQMYVSIRQVPIAWHVSAMTAVVRGEAGVPVATLLRSVDAVFDEIDPGLAVETATMERRVSALLSQRRLALLVLSGFAALSLLLAAIGIYGLLSFAVAQSRREVGIRAALGATRPSILGLVLERALRVVAAGAAAGLILAFWLTRLMESLLVDTPPRDPASFVAAVAVLTVAAGVAALVPAWSAARTDPVEALRTP